jgi:hypothetical protein
MALTAKGMRDLQTHNMVPDREARQAYVKQIKQVTDQLRETIKTANGQGDEQEKEEVRPDEETGFKKFDSNKPEMSMIPYEFLSQLARALEDGKEKYGRNNWRKGCDWSRCADAAIRHLAKWCDPSLPDEDEDSGISHLAHAAANLTFLIEMQTKGLGSDDR